VGDASGVGGSCRGGLLVRGIERPIVIIVWPGFEAEHIEAAQERMEPLGAEALRHGEPERVEDPPDQARPAPFLGDVGKVGQETMLLAEGEDRRLWLLVLVLALAVVLFFLLFVSVLALFVFVLALVFIHLVFVLLAFILLAFIHLVFVILHLVFVLFLFEDFLLERPGHTPLDEEFDE
jgi:hypothetical protein